MIKKIMEASWTFFTRMFGRLFQLMGDLFGSLFQTLFTFLKKLLQPIFIVVALVLYFVYKVAEIAITLIKLFLILGKLLLAFIKGIFVTLAGFTFTPTARNDGSWTPIFKNVVGGLETYQMANLAYVLQFCIWFGVGWAALRILGSIRNGGD